MDRGRASVYMAVEVAIVTVGCSANGSKHCTSTTAVAAAPAARVSGTALHVSVSRGLGVTLTVTPARGAALVLVN